MRSRNIFALLALALFAALIHATPQNAPAPSQAIASAQAFRCQDEFGRFQYQQWPCPSKAHAQQVNIQDTRTNQQRSQARRMAAREQDLARHVSYVRAQQERRSVDATAKPKRLTVATRHVAPATQIGTVVPRKRDFRAVSAQAEKRSTKSKPKRKHHSAVKPADVPSFAG